MKRGRLRVFLKQPGGWRILAGGTLVFLLALATASGSAWTAYKPDEMDLDRQLSPPSIAWLKRIMATDAALKGLDRQAGDRGHGQAPAAGSDDEDLGFLKGGEGEGASPEGARGDGGQEALDARPGPAGKPHLLGTDRNGRDMLALLVAGARNCFLPGLVTCAFALGLGVPLGLLAGYYGGRVRVIVGTFNSTILSLPRLVLILVVICALEPNVYYTMGVLGATLIPRVSELIATRVRILSNMGFILAAKEAALSDFKILYRHLFWYQNRAVFIIQFSLIMAESILVETTLSYLQFGTKPPEVSWGNIIEGSQMSFFSGLYWITFFPAAAIILAILGFFYLGDGLNARLSFREGR
jgi:peptide/nickel transport system permease protein